MRLWQGLVFGLLLIGSLIGFQNCGQFQSSQSGFSGGSLAAQLEVEQAKALTILTNNCASCHGPLGSGGVSNITDVDHLIETGLIQPGRPEDSPLLVSIESNQMPPNNPLQTRDKMTLENWVLLLGGIEPSSGSDLSDLSFEMKVSTDPLPYRARLAKVVHLVGNPFDSSLTNLQAQDVALGDFDFSQGILPKFTWETREMGLWLQGLDPVCRSPEMIGRYPFPAGLQDFILDAMGRELNATEDSVRTTLTNQTGLTNPDRFRLFCLTTLASMEFLSK